MADASPTWGTWVTHVDSAGQAPTMSVAFNQPVNTTGSILFDRMVIALNDTRQYNLAGGIALAGHFPLELPDEFPLAGFLLIVRGQITKSHRASAILTGSIGGRAFARDWPATGPSFVIGDDGKPTLQPLDMQEFVITCFSDEQHLAVGDPPKFPPMPPVTLSLGLQARRPSSDDTVMLQVDGIDITMLR